MHSRQRLVWIWTDQCVFEEKGKKQFSLFTIYLGLKIKSSHNV